MKQKLVVVGNGMAPGRVLEDLFEASPDAWDVTIFNAEPRVNYNRIMLSPVLSGESRYEDIIVHDDDWYAERGITLLKGNPVTAIDRDAKTVTGQDGTVASYDKLIVATGSSPFIIPVPGHNLPGVLTYRDLDDVEAMLEAAARPGARAVVIGGGLLGLEAAAGLKMQGMEVTVLHLMPTLMERQLDTAAGYLLEKAIADRGIRVITKANTSGSLWSTDWDNTPIPHLNGTIPAKRLAEQLGGGGGKKRKKGNAPAWTPPAFVSNDEQQARESRAKRFEAHLQGGNTIPGAVTASRPPASPHFSAFADGTDAVARRSRAGGCLRRQCFSATLQSSRIWMIWKK